MLRPNGHRTPPVAQWRLLSSCLTPKRNSDTCRNSGCQMYSLAQEIWIDVHTLRWGKKSINTNYLYKYFQLTSSSISTTSLWSKNRSALWTKDTEVPGLNSIVNMFFFRESIAKPIDMCVYIHKWIIDDIYGSIHMHIWLRLDSYGIPWFKSDTHCNCTGFTLKNTFTVNLI